VMSWARGKVDEGGGGRGKLFEAQALQKLWVKRGPPSHTGNPTGFLCCRKKRKGNHPLPLPLRPGVPRKNVCIESLH